ncbi:MAG: hypothetical protein ACK4TJ_07470 [Tabrizicola sp.]
MSEAKPVAGPWAAEARRAGEAISHALRDAGVRRLQSCLSPVFDRPD